MSRFRKVIGKLFVGRPRLKAKHLVRMSPKEVFDTIYERNAWNGTDSVSGKGSDREQTDRVASELPRILRELNARSLLDVPCGDFFWMRHVDLAGIKYVGADTHDDGAYPDKMLGVWSVQAIRSTIGESRDAA